MKAIQITFDEELLRELDASKEVREKGRSAVMRQAVAEYLSRRRKQEIARAYEMAYGSASGIEDDFEGWEDQGQWPES